MVQEVDRRQLAMTKRRRMILALTLALTALILAAYVPLAWLFVGFSFGTFALYALIPMLGVYAVGLILFRIAAPPAEKQ